MSFWSTLGEFALAVLEALAKENENKDGDTVTYKDRYGNRTGSSTKNGNTITYKDRNGNRTGSSTKNGNTITYKDQYGNTKRTKTRS